MKFLIVTTELDKVQLKHIFHVSAFDETAVDRANKKADYFQIETIRCENTDFYDIVGPARRIDIVRNTIKAVTYIETEFKSDLLFLKGTTL